MNVGKEIKDFYCNGYAGRRYDLVESIIEAEGEDWIVIRTEEGEPLFMELGNEKQNLIEKWT